MRRKVLIFMVEVVFVSILFVGIFVWVGKRLVMRCIVEIEVRRLLREV